MPFDPLELSEKTERIVTRPNEGGHERKYYRFRADRWYGGVATADATGCNLRCAFCWGYERVAKPERVGSFFSAEEVASRLLAICGRKGLPRARVSGGEPTIGRKHLVSVLEQFGGAGVLFILETNGLLIGADKSYAGELSRFSDLHVRVSIKGTKPGEFSRLTGAKKEAFELQLRALKNLLDSGVSAHASAMISFSQRDGVEYLLSRLEEIDVDLPQALEEEHVILYSGVLDRLRRAGLQPIVATTPRGDVLKGDELKSLFFH